MDMENVGKLSMKQNALTLQCVQIQNRKENSLLLSTGWSIPSHSVLQESVGFLHIQNPEQIS